MTRAIYGAVFVVSLAVAAWAQSAEFSLERELRWARGLGWLGLGTLLLTLSVSPLRRWLGPARTAAARRALGISVACVASAHALSALLGYLGNSWGDLLDLAWVRAGLAAWAVLAALWLTSYTKLTRLLRVRLWKPLHRLAFVAMAFALWHALLAPMSNTRAAVAAATLAAILVTLRVGRAAWVLARRRRRRSGEQNAVPLE